MQKLKVGDIKKFNKGGEEFVGVVVGHSHNGLSVITADGRQGNLYFTDNITYSATRLDPKLRSQLELIAEEKRKYDKMEEDYKKLAVAKEKQLEKVRAEISKVLAIQGKFGVRDTCDIFEKYLKKAHPNLCKKLLDDYSWEANNTPVGIWLQMRRSDYFDKWVSPNRYDFLYKEYDGQLMIHGETKQYKDLCKKYGNKDAQFTMGALKGKYQTEGKIYAGDKDSLTYMHTISILIPNDCMTESYIEKLVSTIKY